LTAKRIQWSVAVVIVALSTLECVLAYPELPDPMATNFGGDGVAGGWSSKRGFVTVYAISIGFWVVALLAVPLFASSTRRNFDVATRRWLHGATGWFLLASLAFSAMVTHWVLEANLITQRLNGAFVWLLAAYLAYMTWWTVRLVRRMRPSGRRK
jgi:uncharacterized membrane protein